MTFRRMGTTIGKVECPLCQYKTRMTKEGRMYRHRIRGSTVMKYCEAGGHTLGEASTILRMRNQKEAGRRERDKMFTDVDVAMDIRRRGSNRRIAMVLYNAVMDERGDITIEQLREDWDLDKDDLYLVTREIRRGWKEGRWPDRRIGKGDRRERDDDK